MELTSHEMTFSVWTVFLCVFLNDVLWALINSHLFGRIMNPWMSVAPPSTRGLWNDQKTWTGLPLEVAACSQVPEGRGWETRPNWSVTQHGWSHIWQVESPLGVSLFPITCTEGLATSPRHPGRGQKADCSRRACVGKETGRKHFPLFTATLVKNKTLFIIQPLKMGLIPALQFLSRLTYLKLEITRIGWTTYSFHSRRKTKIREMEHGFTTSTKANILRGTWFWIKKKKFPPNSTKMQKWMGFEG